MRFLAIPLWGLLSLAASGVAWSQDDLDALDALDALDDIFGTDAGLRLHQHRFFVAIEHRSYLSDRDLPSRDEQLIVETELELDIRYDESWRFLLTPRFLIDALDTDLLRYEPLEAYVAFTTPYTSLRVGQFIENWGVAEVNNPLDVLNRRDLGVDFLDPPRLGELGVRFSQAFDGGEVFDQPALSLYVMPVFRTIEFPTEQSRFRPTAPDLDFGADSGQEPDFVDGVFAAARFEHTLNTSPFNADVAYLVARGPERTPYFVPQFTSTGIDLVPIYYGHWVGGLGLRAVPNALGWSQLTLKGEFAYKRPYELDAPDGVRQDDFIQYTTGFDLLVSQIFSELDQVLVTLEYAAEYGATDLASQFRPFDSDVALRLFWEAQSFARASFEIVSAVDVQSGELLLSATFGTQLRFVHDELRFEVSGDYLRAATSEDTLLSVFTDNSRVSTRLRLDL